MLRDSGLSYMSSVCLIRLDGVSLNIKKAEAKRMVDKGLAVWIGRKSARLIECRSHQPAGNLKCGQAETYMKCAIEKHPRFYNGGLTRNEHQPNAKPGILSWGHIGENKSSSTSHRSVRSR